MIMDDITIKEFIWGMKNQKLEALNMACEMMMFDFGIYKLHTQCLTRIIKGNDILVTTLDYQSWDGEKDTNNDEWYFVDKFRDEIVGGVVVSVELSAINDLRLELSNGIVIELFLSNGYHHFDEEREQWRLLQKNAAHLVINSKTIDYYS